MFYCETRDNVISVYNKHYLNKIRIFLVAHLLYEAEILEFVGWQVDTSSQFVV